MKTVASMYVYAGIEEFKEVCSEAIVVLGEGGDSPVISSHEHAREFHRLWGILYELLDLAKEVNSGTAVSLDTAVEGLRDAIMGKAIDVQKKA